VPVTQTVGRFAQEKNVSNKIHKGATEFNLDCFSDCGNVLVDYQRTQKAFEKIARSEGWKKVDGIWVCPKCAQQSVHPTRAGVAKKFENFE